SYTVSKLAGSQLGVSHDAGAVAGAPPVPALPPPAVLDEVPPLPPASLDVSPALPPDLPPAALLVTLLLLPPPLVLLLPPALGLSVVAAGVPVAAPPTLVLLAPPLPLPLVAGPSVPPSFEHANPASAIAAMAPRATSFTHAILMYQRWSAAWRWIARRFR